MSMRKDIFFLSDGLKLEGVLYSPKKVPEKPLPAAIVVHPHPQFGGSMYNNVVDAVCEELENSMFALKFNCRGVGRSEGTHSGGKEEGKDVLSAIEYLKENVSIDRKRIIFIGYSWGTYVGLPVTNQNPDIKLLVALSCPVGLWNYGYLKKSEKPKLLIVGSYDQFAPKEKIERLFKHLLDPKELFILETDHFYMGQERTMATKVSDFLERFL